MITNETIILKAISENKTTNQELKTKFGEKVYSILSRMVQNGKITRHKQPHSIYKLTRKGKTELEAELETFKNAKRKPW